jgi:hypothetical protein
MDIESRLEILRRKTERLRAGPRVGRKGFPHPYRHEVLALSNEVGARRVHEVTGVPKSTIESWSKRSKAKRRLLADCQTINSEQEIAVTRLSLDSKTGVSNPEPTVLARFWIGETPVEIFSADVVYKIASRSLGQLQS